jgi:hypothetical protein
VCLINQYVIKTYGEVEAFLHEFFMSALDVDELSPPPGHFALENGSRYPLSLEKERTPWPGVQSLPLPVFELRFLHRPISLVTILPELFRLIMKYEE